MIFEVGPFGNLNDGEMFGMRKKIEFTVDVKLLPLPWFQEGLLDR